MSSFRANSAPQTSLPGLSDRLRSIAGPANLRDSALAMAGRHLGGNRVGSSGRGDADRFDVAFTGEAMPGMNGVSRQSRC